MKKYGLIAFLISIALVSSAQTISSSSWPTIVATRGGFSFKMPELPSKQDSLGILLYTEGIDSTIALEVHYIDSVTIEKNNPMIDSLIAASDNDVLMAFTKMIVFSTGGEITAFQHLETNNRGVEVGIKQIDEAGREMYAFSRLFFYNKKFLVFTINGQKDVLPKIVQYKDLVFNSVVIL